MKFRLPRWQKTRLLGLVSIPYIVSLVAILILPNLKTEVQVSDEIGVAEGAETIEGLRLDNDSLLMFIQIVNFNPTQGTAELKALPWPTGDEARRLTSSVFVDRDLEILIDRLDVREKLVISKGSQIGAIPFTVDVLSLRNEGRANDFFYPFDRYEADNYIFVRQRGTDGEWEPIAAIEDFYLWSPLPGFDVTFERTIFNWDAQDRSEMTRKFSAQAIIEERKKGDISYFASISRSKASFIITLLITVFCMTCSIALFAILTRIIQRRRPPSTQVLVWAAATTLGEIQLRSLLPGNPRIGIAFDLLIIFPSLFLSIVVVAVTSFLWIKREDYVS